MDKSESKKAAVFIGVFAFAYTSFIETLIALGIDYLRIVLSAAGVAMMTALLMYHYMEFKRKRGEGNDKLETD